MKINAYSTNKLQTNAYVIENENKCILIDPCVKYDDIFKNSDIELVAVIITHAHFDHIDQLSTYLNKGLKFYMHKNAYPKLSDPAKNISVMTGYPLSYNLDNEEVIFVDDGDVLNLIGKELKIMYTPGHSDCSIMIVVDEYIFSGDMIFRGSIGRYDFYSSSYESIINSIIRIKELNKNYHVFPGHGNKTSLDYEKKNNPFFR